MQCLLFGQLILSLIVLMVFSSIIPVNSLTSTITAVISSGLWIWWLISLGGNCDSYFMFKDNPVS